MVRDSLNSYFGFNRQQRNGLLVLMTISLVLLIVRITYPYFLAEGDIKVMQLSQANGVSSTALPSTEKFDFDPNTADAATLQRLGFSERTAATLLKYRKGHPLKRKEDLRKVFGVSDSLYRVLEPHVVIEGKPSSSSPTSKPMVSAVQSAPLDLNSADSTQLEKLPGIGPAFARRIIKYRNMLGGFHEKTQLLEVYGFSADQYKLIEKMVYADPARVSKLDLNKDDFKVVNRHPYISYELTKSLFNTRRKTPLTEQSTREIIANDSIFSRLLPYLRF